MSQKAHDHMYGQVVRRFSFSFTSNQITDESWRPDEVFVKSHSELGNQCLKNKVKCVTIVK